MMITLSENAERSLQDYLRQARAYLRRSKSVDADEVEQNITEHIENELEGAAEPVSRDVLDAVLKKLGKPQQWVPEEELPWWWRIIFRLRSGPEDWRLAYISLAFLVAGILTLPYVPMGIVLILAGFLASRAAVAEAGGSNELKAQKWLLYPSLIIVYVFVLLVLVTWPLGLLIPLADGFENADLDMFPWNSTSETSYWTIAFVLIIAVMSLWWLILGMIHRKAPRFFGTVFRPFVEIIKPKSLKRFMVIMAGITLICVSAFILMMKYQG